MLEKRLAAAEARAEGAERLQKDAVARAEVLGGQLHATTIEAEARVAAAGDAAQQHISLAQATAQQISQHAAAQANEAGKWCAEQVAEMKRPGRGYPQHCHERRARDGGGQPHRAAGDLPG